VEVENTKLPDPESLWSPSQHAESATGPAGLCKLRTPAGRGKRGKHWGHVSRPAASKPLTRPGGPVALVRRPSRTILALCRQLNFACRAVKSCATFLAFPTWKSWHHRLPNFGAQRNSDVPRSGAMSRTQGQALLGAFFLGGPRRQLHLLGFLALDVGKLPCVLSSSLCAF
jgi:hypothetical protein